jgi:hypothetical protein
VAEARAEIDRQRAQALMALGGENFVAREMAPLIGALRGGVLSGVDPFDFDQWMARFGAKDPEPESERRPRSLGSNSQPQPAPNSAAGQAVGVVR